MQVDVLVAGGGPAGCAAAAGLSDLGLSVLVADAGQDRTRVLAGELLHPAGVEDLKTLGLYEALARSQAHGVSGFAVVDRSERGTRQFLVPYPAGDRGLSLEHAPLVQPLLDALEGKPGLQVWRRARVTALQRNDAQGVEARVARDGREELVQARLLVGADGRASQVRRLLAIPEEHERLSTMLGVVVDAGLLPHPGHGHLFVGGPAPVLAYAIGEGLARVMLDLPLGSTPDTLRGLPELMSGLPAALRAAVLEALERKDGVRMASNDTRLPAVTTQGSAVLVGDAAGCCHPVSASGLASGIRDARELQTFIEVRRNEIPLALARYARARRPAQRTRIALASALYRAFADRGPDMDALRDGLFRYWEQTEDGARISMSLLSGRETRMWVMAREYARVVGHGVAALAGRARQRDGRGLSWIARAGTGLLASALPHLQSAAQGAVQDFESRLEAPLYAPAAEPLSDSRAPESRS